MTLGNRKVIKGGRGRGRGKRGRGEKRGREGEKARGRGVKYVGVFPFLTSLSPSLLLDGGCLRMYVGGETKDVEPLGDRLLLFWSAHVDHEVLVSHNSRFAVTMWFY